MVVPLNIHAVHRRRVLAFGGRSTHILKHPLHDLDLARPAR
jgi:hypothetical protein